MKIGIITAMPEETRPILKQGEAAEKISRGPTAIWRFRFGKHDILLAEAGMGTRNAAVASAALVSEEPELIISAGFGGGVRPGLGVADVLVADQVLRWTGTGLEEVPVTFYGGADTVTPMGSFITCDGILNKQQLAGLLPKGITHAVVEMESAAVARVAAEHGVPFLGIRVVSDPWDEELGFAITEFCDERLRIRPLKVAATILRRPYIIPQLIRLARYSRLAAGGLGQAMARLLCQL